MSLAPPEAAGPLRRERLRTARLYFVCDARPRGRDPEPLLRAALGGGVDIVQLREKELPRREIERRGAHLPPPLRHLQRPLHRQRRPRAGPRLRRRRRPRRPGRRLRRRGPRAARTGGDHRPLDPLRGADRGRGRGARRLHQRRPGLGDADQRGAPRRSASSSSPMRPRSAPHPFFAIGGIDPSNAGAGRRGRRAAARGGAGDPRRRGAGGRGRIAAGGARPAPARGAGWLSSRASARSAAPTRRARADGARLREGRGAQPGGARGARAAGRGRAAAGGHDRRGDRRR